MSALKRFQERMRIVNSLARDPLFDGYDFAGCITGLELSVQARYVEELDDEQAGKRLDRGWPWCTACSSYHQVNNPTCRKLQVAQPSAWQRINRVLRRVMPFDCAEAIANDQRR